jgi:predicted ATPase/DNA-binding XRE family transcriptional regulator
MRRIRRGGTRAGCPGNAVSTGSDAGSFSLLLRQTRVAAALSQEELAERAGLSARGVSDLERGLRRAPRLETVRMLADALGMNDAERAALLVAARAPLADSAAASSPSLGLPEPATRLVGRDPELAELRGLFAAAGVRLLTLTGPGGSGKTRLAIALAKDVGDRFPDGAVFVDLAPIADPALVLATVAQAVGLRSSGADLAGALSAFLRSKRVLLLLDNFEHLLRVAGAVAELLRNAPDLVVLATSREPLRLRGEREFAVQPLGLPDARHAADPARLAESGAVTLFVERAHDVRADFTLTAENAPIVADICRRLDGLPLALELAAARVRGLPLALLRDRLEEALPLLTGGPRDAPERQQSLRNSIAWSFDLLSDDEQALFQRLGVFVGGWTLDVAEVVSGGEGFDVLGGIASLVDKSLVRLDESGAAPRYRMLETVREFALERLERSGEREAINRAHAAFFADLVIAAESGLSAGVLSDVARVAIDIDNLRAALAWLLENGDAETALRMTASLSEFWTFTGGQFSEGYAWLDRALALGSGASPSARAGGYYGIAILSLHQADLGKARAAATAGLELARSVEDPVRIFGNAFMLSSVEGSEGRRAEAMALALEAAAAARAAGDRNWIGWTLLRLGAERHAVGDLEGSITAYEEARDVFHAIEGRWGEADVIDRLALAVQDQGDFRRAASLHARALMLRRDVGAATGIQNEFVGLADIARDTGELDAAAFLLGAADACEERFGYAPFRESPRMRRNSEQTVRELLGEKAFARSRDRGRSMATNDAITAALAIADRLSDLRSPERPDQGRSASCDFADRP